MRRRRNTEFSAAFVIFALAVIAFAGRAYARKTDGVSVAPEPCAVIDGFAGTAQVLDDTRLNMTDISQKKSVPCGGWVSVESGWVTLHHRDGFRMSLASGTFVQFPEADKTGDPMILFRGQAFGQVDGGAGEFRIVTPNGRARLKRGSVILSFDGEEQRTQLVAVDGSAFLENRFENSEKAEVKAGQFSTLDFKLLRVIPSVARPISTASIHAKLKELHIPDTAKHRALEYARLRQKETFRPVPVVASTEKPKSDRAPASTRERAKSETYSATEEENFQRHMINRMTAGEPDGARILYPGSSIGKTGVPQAGRKVIVEEDPAAALRHKESQAEEAERKRLIEELSAIRPE